MFSNTGLSRGLAHLYGRKKETSEEIRGPHGLHLLFAPSMTIVDFIFVHGLGGGSRSTWSKSDDASSFWPQEWLPKEPNFENVRIHSFGYNADWSAQVRHALDVHDFGKALLQAMAGSPDLRNRQDCPIVLIGHSMGGLVIKWAFLLSQKDPAFKDMKRRMKTLFFLGTPHRGADLAKYLTNILHVTHSSRPYVTDLQKDSVSLKLLNEEFRHCVEGIHLHSFYETKEMDVIVARRLIVGQFSATTGFSNERTAPFLDTDHCGMTKFDSKDDTNYRTLCDALAAATESIRSQC